MLPGLKGKHGFLFSASHKEEVRKSLTDFTKLMSIEEADELEYIIEEGCEQINSDDWK